ncbi:MAG: hypothetical protein MJZ02_07725 [Paludibacteraceae bacterium]|nr:hypothetical protein [Paludibacteraceae bacterium]
MKSFKKFIVVLESMCLIGMITFFIMFFFPKKIGVDYILSVVDIEIPHYDVVSKKEKWQDYYDYEICFPTEYSESIIKQFKNKKDCQKFQTEYDGKIVNVLTCEYSQTNCNILCTDNTAGDYYYYVYIRPQEGKASVQVSYEFGEQFDCVLYIVALLFLALVIGVIYVITLLVHNRFL